MGFRSTVPSQLRSLSLRQALALSNVYLENAHSTQDLDIALVLCHEAEIALSQAKSVIKKVPTNPEDTEYRALRDGVATAYIELGKLLEHQGHRDEALPFCKNAEKWRGDTHNPGQLS